MTSLNINLMTIIIALAAVYGVYWNHVQTQNHIDFTQTQTHMLWLWLSLSCLSVIVTLRHFKINSNYP